MQSPWTAMLLSASHFAAIFALLSAASVATFLDLQKKVYTHV
jgi:hypothetical protein